MNRELAESYVQYGINATVFTKKKCTAFLPFNILFLGIATILFRKIYFLIIITIIIIIATITSIVFKRKWSAFFGFLSQATQLLIFAITLDCIYFAISHALEKFVWYEFLISIIIQVVAFPINLSLVVSSAKRHDIHKKPVINKSAGLVAGLSCILTLIVLKVFLTEISMSFIFIIMSFLINIFIILLSYAIVMAYYRAYLIKKFHLVIELN